MKPFKSDGCTLSPDMRHKICCVLHDKDYHKGGDWIMRLKSDILLGFCVASKYHWSYGWFIGFVYFLFPRLFGGPYWPEWFNGKWRWGFGHKYPRYK